MDKSFQRENPNNVIIKSETGALLMNLSAFRRQGKKMVIEGTMIDSWETRVLIDFEDAWKMLGKLVTKEMLLYMLLLPFWILKKRFQK